MKHPGPEQLALLAGGELRGWARWRLGWHLRRCPKCAAELQEYVEQRHWLREVGEELPSGLDWDRLAAEMTANIHVGLAAGECVRGWERVTRFRPRWAALALVSLALLVLGGWWLYAPRVRPVDRWAPAEVIAEATGEGLQLRNATGSMTLVFPENERVIVSVSGGGGVRASYVDEQTGLITISHVYVP